MPITWQKEADDLVVLTVSGQLSMAEYLSAQQQVVSGREPPGKYRVLVLLDHFAGWTADKGWGDVSSAEKIDPHIEKMAIVGDPQWEGSVAAFTLQGLRPFPIEYFSSGNDARARDWLMSAT
jgi:hypothetical protein